MQNVLDIACVLVVQSAPATKTWLLNYLPLWCKKYLTTNRIGTILWRDAPGLKKDKTNRPKLPPTFFALRSQKYLTFVLWRGRAKIQMSSWILGWGMGGALRHLGPVHVGVIARVAIDDAPWLGVDDAVGDAAFLLEAFRENGNLNASIRQRGVVLNK